jgi:GNAT superfamily N-acetyltransferase
MPDGACVSDLWVNPDPSAANDLAWLGAAVAEITRNCRAARTYWTSHCWRHLPTRTGDLMSQYTTGPLDVETWDAFARLCEKHGGMGFGGCWCTWFHPRRKDAGVDVEAGRPYKELLVREGKAHAALVFDGDDAVGWCQFGPPAELPCIYHRKEYEGGLVSLPDYRLTCIFVDRNHRREGLAAVAVEAALQLIARAGGGVVEAYPHDTAGKKMSASFIYDGTRSMFEKLGFDYERPKGKNNCVMRKVVPAA